MGEKKSRAEEREDPAAEYMFASELGLEAPPPRASDEEQSPPRPYDSAETAEGDK